MIDFKRLNTADEKYAEYLTDFRDNHRQYLQDLANNMFSYSLEKDGFEYDLLEFYIINDYEEYKSASYLRAKGINMRRNELHDEFSEFIDRHEQTLCDVYDVGNNPIYFTFKRGEEMQVDLPSERDRSYD